MSRYLNAWERTAITEALMQLASEPRYAGSRGAADMKRLAEKVSDAHEIIIKERVVAGPFPLWEVSP